MNEEILEAAFSVPMGYDLQAGALILDVEDVETRVEDLIFSVRGMSAAVDRQQIRELAALVRLKEWQGRSKKFYRRTTEGRWVLRRLSLQP